MTEPATRQTESLIILTAQEICQACSGEQLSGSGADRIGAVSTDSRAEQAGGLFVALKGERFDGGDFAAAALEKGAAGVLAEAAVARRLAAAVSAGDSAGPVIIAVEDTGRALQEIAALATRRSPATVIGITGSTGKTSTKDFLYGLIRDQLETVACQASFNNEVGVPLTLLKATTETEVVIAEMGMRLPGEIRELCRIAAPEIGIITNIGPAHLQFAGSLQNIAAGKAELALSLPEGGTMIAPYGEKLLKPHLQSIAAQLVTFGFNPAADVHQVGQGEVKDGRLCCTLSVFGEEVEACFNFAARHQLLNAMAAMAAYRLLGLPLDALPDAVVGIHPPRLRGELLPLAGGGFIINDCYNANPLSMESSLAHLAEAGAGRRTVAILGDMSELGADSPAYHRHVGGLVADLDIDCLIAIGEQAGAYVEGAAASDQQGSGRRFHRFTDRREALAAVPDLLEPGDAVLVKASRFMELEELSELLAGKEPGQENDADV